MATTRPFAYNPSGTGITGASQFANLAVGDNTVDYSTNPGGIKWFMGPDEDPGYIVALAVTGGNYSTPTGSNDGTVEFWRSDAKTDDAFVSMADVLSNQFGGSGPFPSATGAKAWMDAASLWTSWADTWQFNSGGTLSWPASTTGYTLYTGGFTNADDGYSNSPIVSIDPFEMNGQGSSSNIYVSTNGYVTLGSGSSNIIYTPQGQTNPAAIAGNPGDNWLQPGLVNNDGDVQNLYYLTGGVPGRSYIKFLVYGGQYAAATNPTSWVLNLYIDGQYQWVETRIKSNIRGNAGPYNSSDVSQIASTTSRVWRGDLNGQNWVYMGTGTII